MKGLVIFALEGVGEIGHGDDLAVLVPFIIHHDMTSADIAKLADAPDDWFKCHVIPPRAVNVDVGYTSEAKIAELNAGLTDYDSVAGAHGGTAEVIFRRKARQIALIKKIADEETTRSGFEVKPEEIAGNLADILEKMAMAQAASEPEGDEPPTPAKKKKQQPVPA